MNVTTGMKVTIGLPNGLRWPGVAISDATAEKVTVVNRTTNLPVSITVTRFDVITLRETREGAKYLALTQEVAQYGYRPVAEPRFSNLVGLDATEEGEIIALQALIEDHGKSFSEWQAKNFEARKGVTAADAI